MINLEIIIGLISMIFQVLLFLIIPLVFYIASNKKISGFYTYIGFKKTNKSAYLESVKFSILSYLFTFFCVMIPLRLVYGYLPIQSLVQIDKSSITSSIILLIIYGVQTGLSEELFFRGFLAKNIINKFGLNKGNLIQSLIFMIFHLSTFKFSWSLDCILPIINTFVVGYTFGYLMIKKTNGSILPLVICHAVINMVSVIVINFL